MSENKMNEDNCVLNSNKLETIEKSLNHYLAKIFPHDMKFAKEHSLSLFLKINKLNEMAKQAKDKINHNDYIRHDTAPF